MVIDTSALICVFFSEPEAIVFSKALERAPVRRMSAPSYVECCIVVASRHGPSALPAFERFLQDAEIDIVPFSRNAARVAAEAFVKFGKGRHPAGLNFGDCMSYALARTELMPLLFKGDDFRLTDVEAVL